MNTLKKRIICVLLAVLMIACILPVGVSAEGESTEKSETLVYDGNTGCISRKSDKIMVQIIRRMPKAI